MEKTEQTIVIRRAKRGGGGAHGGSWKIAFADFALAMMAFFLVLWLIESTTELEKMVIAGYFSDPRSLADRGDGGTPYVLDLGGRPLDLANQGLNIALVREDQEQVVESPQELEVREYMELARLREKETMENLAGELEEALGGNESFEWFNENILMEQTDEGLLIQIVDRNNRALFDIGQDRLQPFARQILWTIAEVLAPAPNMMTVYGHTDALPFNRNNGEYTNWELSTDRANAARRALLEGGMDYEQFAQIIGLGSSVPFDVDDPTNPANRRIVILVMNELSRQRLQNSLRSGEEDSPFLPPESILPVPEIF